ncbi:hypothetical protein BC455_15990 [Vibrio harveyi]|uniref:hypothetical protein n=1 Tax=Vibrio harveyi TaxID=669 RepID=UPI0008412A5F|nr:hypothetical protein [Vibrio harveyi]ODM57895.1 hypothetical protein BC455_15990 [Vibrio harveyi]
MFTDFFIQKNRKAGEKHAPNSFPKHKLVLNLVVGVFLVVYGAYGIYSGELYVFLGRRTEVTLHGDAIYIAFAAFILGCIYCLVEIIDHFDKRDNEEIYIRIRAGCQAFGLLIFGFALIQNSVMAGA